MALRRLISSAGKARALGLPVRESLEAPVAARTSSLLVGATSSHCWNDDLRWQGSCWREEPCSPSECADFVIVSSVGRGVSVCIEESVFWRQAEQFYGRDSTPTIGASLADSSKHKSKEGFSPLDCRPALTSVVKNPLHHIASGFHIRHHSTTAVNTESTANSSATNVNPSLTIHREQFLRAASRKVEKPQPVIRAYLRELCGKNPNKKERKQGLIPGIVFSGKGGHMGGNKRLISVGHKQLSAILQPLGKFFFSAMTWDLEVYDGRPGEEATAKKTVERVVPKSVHLHAATDEPMNVTFMRVFPEEKFIVDVPLVFLGEDACPGLKKGGRLNTLRRLVRYECPGDKIPPYLEVDISTLNIGQSVRLKDLPADPALRLTLKDPDWLVVKISGRTQEEESSTEGS